MHDEGGVPLFAQFSPIYPYLGRTHDKTTSHSLSRVWPCRKLLRPRSDGMDEACRETVLIDALKSARPAHRTWKKRRLIGCMVDRGTNEFKAFVAMQATPVVPRWNRYKWRWAVWQLVREVWTKCCDLSRGMATSLAVMWFRSEQWKHGVITGRDEIQVGGTATSSGTTANVN